MTTPTRATRMGATARTTSKMGPLRRGATALAAIVIRRGAVAGADTRHLLADRVRGGPGAGASESRVRRTAACTLDTYTARVRPMVRIELASGPIGSDANDFPQRL